MGSITHEIHRMKNPQLPFIFHLCRVEANGILPNWHENIELLCFLEGEGTMTLDGRPYRVGQGDVGVVNADRLHVTGGEPTLSYYCLIVDSGFCMENGIDVSCLEFSELVRDEAIFAAHAEICALFERLQEGKADPAVVPAIRHCVLGILLRLVSHHLTAGGQESKEEARGRDRVKEVVRYLRTVNGAISLDEVAKEMGMSKFYLCREFKRITGTTVVAYLNRTRCERARRMIYEGAKVSEAAFAVGFDNLSYFSRTFLRYIGIHPSACQRRSE